MPISREKLLADPILHQKQKDRQKACYQKKKELYKAKIKEGKAKKKKWLQEYKSTLKCIKCEEKHPACLQFHHRDPNTKEENISNSPQRWSIEHIKREIEKCDVLCANCHAKLHYKE